MKGSLCKDIKRRDEIIFGNYDSNEYRGGIRRFENMSYDTLKQLVDEGFVDVEDRQNFAPTIQEMMEFSKKYDKHYYFDGYIVSDERDDYRLSVDAIKRDEDRGTLEEGYDFVDFCSEADEIYSNYAWLD